MLPRLLAILLISNVLLAQAGSAARKIELGGGIAMEFVWVEPGSYLRGSPENEIGRDRDEGPQSQVTITKGFFLGRTEVTREQWRAVMVKDPSVFRQASREEIDRRPVDSVSWKQAKEFLRKLEAQGLGRFRLPTEAEWEYAARAGSTLAYPWGDGSKPFDTYQYAWANSRSFATTHQVALKAANAWGLYDMHGNVWEWCEDWYAPYQEGESKDPQGPSRGTEKVFRGGSWFDFPPALRSANRHRHGTDRGYPAIGFRVLMEASPLEERSVNLGNGVAMRFAKAPAGEFAMGSPEQEVGRQKDESPVHPVRITKEFWLGVYEVTQAQWEAVMGSNPSTFAESEERSPLAVEGVSYVDARKFLEKLNGLGVGRFRLPTEAEWEYAARAGSSARFAHGEDVGYRELAKYGWFNPQSEGRSPVLGRKIPNAWGFHDMFGGMWEWVSDWMGPYPSGLAVDPSGPEKGTKRVIRGGSWFNEPEALRSANRNSHEEDSRQTNLGLRLVWQP